MKSIKRTYGIPQEILYSVCQASWSLCSQNLQRFTDLKAFYTEAFVTNALQAVQDAKDLPDIIQTVAVRKEARINLSLATKGVMANWQVLKVYITKAFDASLVKAKLDAAGASYYLKVSVDNWSAVRSLIDTANVFIASNLEDLKANNNMPESFQASFKADGDNCIALSAQFATINIQKQNATGVKLDANNSIYLGVMEMLKDGQQIFKDDPLMKRQFTLTYLVKMYKGERPASLRGVVVNMLNVPVKDVVIESLDLKYRGITNAKGHYRIARIAAGTYTFRISAPGYEPQEQTITFAPGIASKSDLILKAQLLLVA
jgi:hypothetical protein